MLRTTAAIPGEGSAGDQREIGCAPHLLILLLPEQSQRQEAELQHRSARQALSKHLQIGPLSHRIVSLPSQAALVSFQVTHLKKKCGQPWRGFL